MAWHYRWGRLLRDVSISVLLGVVLATAIQTHAALSSLAGLGATVSVDVWLKTYSHDLLYFSPVLCILFLPAFGLSQPVALFLARKVAGIPEMVWCALAASAGLWLSVRILDVVAPTPGLIYASQTLMGFGGLLVAAALSGLLFSIIRKRDGKAERSASRALLASAILVGFLTPSDRADAADLKVDVLAAGLEKPWSVAFLPDGRMLVTEKPGRLRVLDANGKLQGEPVGGVPAVLYSGQGGLFEVLPSKTFAQDGKLFLSYACGTRSANHTCVAGARLDGNQLKDVKEIFRSYPAKSGGAHFGGRMVWLPDGSLVLTLGDGYSYRDEAQSRANHFGKIVRFNPDGSVPADNPFAAKGMARPEIYSMGHRSVQGLVYDETTGRLFAHEHGARGGDEVNLIQAGKNYGWPLATYGVDYSGATISPFKTYNGTEQPLVYWVPSIAPSGMALYRGSKFKAWDGHLLVGALAGRHLRLVKLEGDKVAGQEVLLADLGERIRDVRTGPDEAVYLLTDSNNGRLLKVTPE